MTQAQQGHIRGRMGIAPGKADDRMIPWVETDPARAPLRNDVISALQTALAPVLFWFVFFTGYYPTRTAVGATVVMMLIVFGVAFTFKWARMASARTARETLRSPRRKLTLAVVSGLFIGAVTVWVAGSTYPDRTVQFLLGVAAGACVAVVILALERFALSVPPVERPVRSPYQQLIGPR